MKQKVIQNEEPCPADLLQPLLVLHVVNCLERHELLQKDLTVVLLDLVVVAGNDPQCLRQIGFSAVRWPENTEIHA